VKPGGRRGTPRDAEQALREASDHARAAAAETVLAARCLLDAASLAATGVPVEAHAALRGAVGWLERAARAAADPRPDAARWLTGVVDALDAEISRWEARAGRDPEARAVLRAFLGVREVLWEFGLRRGAAPEAAHPPEARPRRAAPRPVRRSDGVQRVPVEG
jgi:hypothetical protein